MYSLTSLLFSGLLLSQQILAAPSFAEPIAGRQSKSCNSASNRACWSGEFDINTDYELNTPSTGVTRYYEITLTEEENWTGPDGVVKDAVMLVNGDIIGPTIWAQWGDTISVTVNNQLKTNGTTIHWHGIRQLNTNYHDGVNGVTECPITPNGGSRVYTFIARQYGTSWYHSHFSAQYGNGIVGAIQIDGPASLPYDIDLGPLVLSDYYYRTVDQMLSAGATTADNVVFNGTAKHPTTGAGEYKSVTLKPGKRHRLRLINTSVENHFQVSIANHSMTIIASDFVPVNSFTTESLFLGIGQRYDVTIDASQATDNYWLNITYSSSGGCGGNVNPHPAAIIHYDGAPTNSTPKYRGDAPADFGCDDLTSLSPVVTRSVPTAGVLAADNNTLDVGIANGKWTINESTLLVNWNKPVAQYLMEGDTNYPTTDNIWHVNGVDEWTYWLIENSPTVGIPHPIHLHGHDFVVLGKAASATFSAADVPNLRGSNPVRRDVTMLPALGWLLIAFKADNPGPWLLHCHIAFHASGGLGLTFLERPSEYVDRLSQSDIDDFNAQCSAWNDYFPSNDPFPQIDSGI